MKLTLNKSLPILFNINYIIDNSHFCRLIHLIIDSAKQYKMEQYENRRKEKKRKKERKKKSGTEKSNFEVWAQFLTIK